MDLRATSPSSADVIPACQALVIFAASCRRQKAADVARAFSADEAKSLLHCVEIAEEWLEQFAASLEGALERPDEMTANPINSRARPRNKLAFERGRAREAQIEQLLLSHNPLAEPLNEKSIWPRLNPRISERQIRRHLQAIRSKARSE
jgi:hypothetical protein